LAVSAARSTMRAIMSDDSGPPRSETKINGDVLVAFNLRSADTMGPARGNPRGRQQTSKRPSDWTVILYYPNDQTQLDG
jgi:hypothetical protein